MLCPLTLICFLTKIRPIAKTGRWRVFVYLPFFGQSRMCKLPISLLKERLTLSAPGSDQVLPCMPLSIRSLTPRRMACAFLMALLHALLVRTWQMVACAICVPLDTQILKTWATLESRSRPMFSLHLRTHLLMITGLFRSNRLFARMHLPNVQRRPPRLERTKR